MSAYLSQSLMRSRLLFMVLVSSIKTQYRRSASILAVDAKREAPNNGCRSNRLDTTDCEFGVKMSFHVASKDTLWAVPASVDCNGFLTDCGEAISSRGCEIGHVDGMGSLPRPEEISRC